MSRIAILVFTIFYCANIYGQYYIQYNTSKVTAEDVPNIVKHLENAKELLSTNDPNKDKTIPAARIELLYLNNLTDTSHLFSRIENAESLEKLVEFYEDSDFVEDALFYSINGLNDYNLGEWKPYSSMITLSQKGIDTDSIDNRMITFKQNEKNHSVLIMDKVVLAESTPINKLLYKYKAYADSILYPRTIKRESSNIEIRNKKSEKLKEINIDDHLIIKAIDYYDNVIDKESFTRAERAQNVPLKRLLENDAYFVKLLNEGHTFAKDYATTSNRFNYMIKPLLSKEEYYELYLLLSVPQINKGACDFDDKIARAAYYSQLTLNAFEADKHEDFFRMYNGLLHGQYYGNSNEFFTQLDTLGLQVKEFVIGLVVGNAEQSRQHRLEEIANLIANSKNDEEVILTSLEFINNPLVDGYNKYNLSQMLSMIVGYTANQKRKKYLKSKYDLEEIQSTY